MSIVCWNCRGLGSAAAVCAVKDVIKSHRPRVLGLLETKKSARDWEVLRIVLGFSNCFSVDRVGLSGGMAILWNDDVQLNIRNFSRNHVHMEVDLDSKFEFTLFYGNPIESRRRESWSLLRSIQSLTQGPWLIGGDFNEVMFGWEVLRGRCREGAAMRRFREVAAACDLSDLGFQGAPFTFSNKRRWPQEFKGRLDRFLANTSWRSGFHSAIVTHATAARSDHCPIVLNLEGVMSKSGRKQFHFESMWLRHSGFREVIASAWSNAQQEGGNLNKSLEICAERFQFWNKNCFGHVSRKIKELKCQLERLRSGRRTSLMIQKEKETLGHLEEWLEREE